MSGEMVKGHFMWLTKQLANPFLTCEFEKAERGRHKSRTSRCRRSQCPKSISWMGSLDDSRSRCMNSIKSKSSNITLKVHSTAAPGEFPLTGPFHFALDP
jgi:hypothetical protein